MSKKFDPPRVDRSCVRKASVVYGNEPQPSSGNDLDLVDALQDLAKKHGIGEQYAQLNVSPVLKSTAVMPVVSQAPLPKLPIGQLIRHRADGADKSIQLGESRLIDGHAQEPLPEQARYLEEQRRKVDESCAKILAQAKAEAKALVDNARNNADAILSEATQKAEQLLQEAEDTRESIRQEAYDQGHQEGYDTGYRLAHEKAEAETLEMLLRTQALAQRAHEIEVLTLRAFCQDAAKLITHSLKKILGDALKEQPVETVVAIVEAAVNSMDISGVVQVALHPEVARILQTYTPKTAEALAAMKRFEFIGDDSLNPDEIYILSRTGQFNLTPSQVIENLVESIEHTLTVNDPTGEKHAAHALLALPAFGGGGGGVAGVAGNAAVTPSNISSIIQAAMSGAVFGGGGGTGTGTGTGFGGGGGQGESLISTGLEASPTVATTVDYDSENPEGKPCSRPRQLKPPDLSGSDPLFAWGGLLPKEQFGGSDPGYPYQGYPVSGMEEQRIIDPTNVIPVTAIPPEAQKAVQEKIQPSVLAAPAKRPAPPQAPQQRPPQPQGQRPPQQGQRPPGVTPPRPDGQKTAVPPQQRAAGPPRPPQANPPQARPPQRPQTSPPPHTSGQPRPTQPPQKGAVRPKDAQQDGGV